MARIQLLYFDAGGGHAAAARALAAVLRRNGRTGDVELIHVQELLDRLDFVRRWTGLRLQDSYNLLLAHDWTFGMTAAARLLQATIRTRGSAITAELRRHFERTQPDLVVSVIPHFNGRIAAALAQTVPQARMMLVLTDLADTAPSFWLHEVAAGAAAAPHTVVCGTARAVAQARGHGLDETRILATSGMILRAGFYEPAPDEAARARARAALQLSPTLPTALVLAGGAGSRSMIEIAERLERVPQPVQALFLCGRNDELMRALHGLRSRRPRHITGFTEDVPGLMRLADFFIGKPGPGSLSEAIEMRLPPLVVVNGRTLPQERYNGAWLRENDYGIVLRHWRELDGAVARLLAEGELQRLRQRLAGVSNRAVFEIAAEAERQLAGGVEAIAPSRARV